MKNKLFVVPKMVPILVLVSGIFITTSSANAMEGGLRASVRLNTQVNASTSTSSKPFKIEDRNKIKEEKKEIREEARQDRKEDRDERKEERKDKRSELIKSRLNFRFGKMLDRFEATIVRLEKLLDRTNSRIAKVKAAGGNTTVSEKFAAETKTHLTEARESLNTLSLLASSTVAAEIDMGNINASTTSKFITSLKTASASTTMHIKEAKTSLEKAISNIKSENAKLKIDVKASSTSSTSSN